jgi:4-hydroxy-3-polyprenylbenzoate decarboxylase
LEVVIGISGATGVWYGIRILQAISGRHETHLVITDAARKIMQLESRVLSKENAESIDLFMETSMLADHVYSPLELTAPIASGSCRFDAMVIAPCSMKTLSAIASGFSDNLLTRAADVCLKERRKLILVTRETPLSMIHLRNMIAVTEAGGVILPACPGFYGEPEDVEALVNFVAGRTLDLIGIEHELCSRWRGKPTP